MADILIIGAGGVGSVVAHKCAQLAKEGAFGKITLASRTLSRCDEIARSVKARLGVDIATAQVDAAAAEKLLRAQLEEDLLAALGETGEVVSMDFAAREQSGMLIVRLQAECREEIGRFVPYEGQQENETQPAEEQGSSG